MWLNLCTCRNYFLPSLTPIIVRFTWFLVRSKAIVCVQMLCTSSVIFGHSFISIGNWVQICTFCLHHEIGELRGYKGLVCLPDLFLHHSQGPDSSCFCTVHVASCCSSTIMPKSLLSQKSPYQTSPCSYFATLCANVCNIPLFFTLYITKNKTKSWWKRETETPPAATTSYMICAETTKIRALNVVQNGSWKAYQPLYPSGPNPMLQAGGADSDLVSYTKWMRDKSHTWNAQHLHTYNRFRTHQKSGENEQ